MSHTTQNNFVGWIRPVGGRWTVVVGGATLAECWQRLLRHESPSQHNERVVLRRGEDPNRRKGR